MRLICSPKSAPTATSYGTHSETIDSKRKNHMKDVLRSGMYLPIAAMMLTAFAGPAPAQNQVPFKGSLQGHEIDTPKGGPPPTTLAVEGDVTGVATHLGQFSFTYQITVTLSN